MSAVVQQAQRLKSAHPELLLLVECGYKHMAFNHDASIVSSILGIKLIKKSNHSYCSFPSSSLSHQLDKIIRAGHKVCLYIKY